MRITFDDWLAWAPGSKLELLNGQLIVGDSLTHSRLLLSQILRGWGIPALLPFAPSQLWYQALRHTFNAPAITDPNHPDLTALQTWANSLSFTPDLPQHHGDWKRIHSSLKQDLRMALFSLSRNHPIGDSLGSGVVNRLGNDGFMPDIYVYRGEPRNRLYEYFLEGPPEIIIEMIQPGCSSYVQEVKRSRYAAAQVPELWILDPTQQHIDLLRWSNGTYHPQTADPDSRYPVPSVPGLTFFPEQLWNNENRGHPDKSNLFEVTADAPQLDRIRDFGSGIDETRGLTQLQAQLKPTPISFDNYIYWCPEAKFELVDGRPWLGGRQGMQGLTGLLLMTFGLADAVTLDHPREWIQALVGWTSPTGQQQQRERYWQLARQTAAVLKEQFDLTQVAVTGHLVAETPIDFWTPLQLVIWGAPESEQPFSGPERVVYDLSDDPPIHLIHGDRELSDCDQQILSTGTINL